MDVGGTLRGLLIVERPLCVPSRTAAHLALGGGSVVAGVVGLDESPRR